jgi:hypothetical protein
MASQNQNNNNNNVSDVITQAHDCLHGSYTEPSTSANVSQPNVNNGLGLLLLNRFNIINFCLHVTEILFEFSKFVIQNI